MATDISGVMADAEAVRTIAEQILGKQSGKVNEADSARQAEEAAIEKANNANSTLTQQKLMAAKKAEDDIALFKAAVGGQLDDPASLISSLTQRFQDNQKAAQVQMDVIQEMKSHTLETSPVQWLLNQFTINDEIDKHNMYATAADDAAHKIDTIAGLVSNVGKMQVATARTITDVTMQSELEMQQAKGAAALAEVRQKNIQNDISQLDMLRNGQVQELNNEYQQIHLQMQSNQEKRTDEAFLMQKESHAAEMADRQAKAMLAAEGSAEGNTMLEIYNLGAGIHNMPAMASLKDLKAIMQLPGGKAQTEALLNSGQVMFQTGNMYFGEVPSEAAINIAGAKSKFSDTLFAPVAGYLNDKLSEAYSLNSGETNKDIRNTSAQLTMNQQVSLDEKAWSKNAERTGSLYKAPDIVTMLEMNPNLKDTKLAEVVLMPMASTGQDKADFKTLNAQVDQAVKEGKMTEREAVKELSDYYAAAKATNNSNYKFSAVGMMPQVDYVIPSEATGSYLQEAARYDISKPEELQKYRLHNRAVKDATPRFGLGR